MGKCYTDNYCGDLVLFEQPVEFTFTNERQNKTTSFKMALPNLHLLLFDETFKKFLSLINSTISDFAELKKVFNFSSIYELIIEFNRNNNFELCKTYRDIILYSLAALDIKIDMYFEYYTINDVVMPEDLFNRICNIILDCCCIRTMQESMMSEREREMQRRIQKIKSQASGSQNTEKADFQNMYIVLRYEFKMTNDEILAMTLKKARNMVGFGGKITNYLLSLIALGNGNTKKLKHYTEKK